MTVLITDIDGTLAHSSWRDEFKPDWDLYHRRSIEDAPNTPIIELVNSLFDSAWTIVAITTRPERWRSLTVEWLNRYDVMIHEIHMRSNDDFRPSPEVKRDLAQQYVHYPPVLALDDRDDVLNAYIELGFTTLRTRT
jgi:hypothetical protein